MHTDFLLGSSSVFDTEFDFGQFDFSYLNVNVNAEGVPLSQNALQQHTSKFNATLTPPSPLLRDFSLSPVPSSATSSSGDTSSDYFLSTPQPSAKRIKTQHTVQPRTIQPSILPSCSQNPSNVQRKISPSTQHCQPRRYRAILPAPAHLKNQSSHPNIQTRPVARTPTSIQKPQQSIKPKLVQPVFQHQPTNLPPMKYPKGLDTPFRPEHLQGTIPGSMLDSLPLLEDRFDRLENAINEYAKLRHERALKNSLIEGLELDY